MDNSPRYRSKKIKHALALPVDTGNERQISWFEIKAFCISRGWHPGGIKMHRWKRDVGMLHLGITLWCYPRSLRFKVYPTPKVITLTYNPVKLSMRDPTPSELMNIRLAKIRSSAERTKEKEENRKRWTKQLADLP